MGKPDESYYNYLDDDRRFADQINGALFQGEQVVKPDELEPGDAQLVYLGKEAGKRENFKVIVELTIRGMGQDAYMICLTLMSKQRGLLRTTESICMIAMSMTHLMNIVQGCANYLKLCAMARIRRK